MTLDASDIKTETLTSVCARQSVGNVTLLERFHNTQGGIPADAHRCEGDVEVCLAQTKARVTFGPGRFLALAFEKGWNMTSLKERKSEGGPIEVVKE